MFTPDTSIPDEQLVSGYKWIHVAWPTQDTCRRRQAIQMDTTCIRATCIRCKRVISEQHTVMYQLDIIKNTERNLLVEQV